MSEPAANLAFLENFYSNVTLYVPAEPPVASAPVASAPVASAPVASAPVASAPVASAPVASAPVASAPVVPPAQLTPFSTLGTNHQGVVVLVRVPAEQFIKLLRNVFLNKMLEAVGLVMADVVLVNVEDEKLPVALSSLRRELTASCILAFGRNLLDVTIRNTQIYEPVHFPNLGFSYLASATIDSVEYDVSLKKRLWPGLQQLFLR